MERETLAIAGHPDPSPERLHRFHRDLRRIRVELETLRHLLPRGDRDRAAELLRRLGRVARLVGEVRDFDVGLALLAHPRLRRASGSSSEDFVRTRGRLQEEARTGRALLGAFLRAELDRGLVMELERVLAVARPRMSERRLERAAATERARSGGRAMRAIRRARRRPSPRRMHRLRSALRHARHLHELSSPGTGRDLRPFSSRLERLQQALGRLHDLDVLIDGLEGLGPAVWESEWARFERRRRRQLRAEITEELDRKEIRERVARLAE